MSMYEDSGETVSAKSRVIDVTFHDEARRGDYSDALVTVTLDGEYDRKRITAITVEYPQDRAPRIVLTHDSTLCTVIPDCRIANYTVQSAV